MQSHTEPLKAELLKALMSEHIVQEENNWVTPILPFLIHWQM